MTVLFFLPWVSTDESMDFGVLRLIPYQRGEAPGQLDGVTQETLDTILGSYGDRAFGRTPNPFCHLQRATLISWEGVTIHQDLTDDEVYALLEKSRYIAFSALAQRRFGTYTGYCNADGYEVVAQRFEAENPRAISVRTRRRDGFTDHLINRSLTPRFIRPEQVDSRLAMDLDAALLAALINLPEGDLKTRIDEAIDVFLRANTDSSAVPERTEVVLLRVAYETLLGSTHHANELQRLFNEHFADELPTPPQWGTGPIDERQWRSRWPANVARPLDAWIQDLCNARNAAAHGPRGARDASVWHRRNHLLFGSWLFPLMVKKLLQDEDIYHLCDQDIASRQGLEAFFAYDLLSRKNEEPEELWWNYVERQIQLPLLAQMLHGLMNHED